MLRRILSTMAAMELLHAGTASGDGCFVSAWDKEKEMKEPAQKAIILHHQGREDMILQVKYNGPARDFGWIIPTPGLPEVREGSMDCFYELGKLTSDRSILQEESMDENGNAKVIQVKTIGAYEVTVLSAADPAQLFEWLDAHHFIFPKDKRSVLEKYVENHWYFIAVKIDPKARGFSVRRGPVKREDERRTDDAALRREMASGELQPLSISFPTAQGVFPLAISAVNGSPSAVSLSVISAAPLASQIIVDQKFAGYAQKRNKWLAENSALQKERVANQDRIQQMRDRPVNFRSRPAAEIDPNDPKPNLSAMRQLMGIERTNKIPDNEVDYPGGADLLPCWPIDPSEMPACVKQLPRLAGRSWYLTKQSATFAPDEMRDLELTPAVPMVAAKMGPAYGASGPLYCLSRMGAEAVPVILDAAANADPAVRRLATMNMANMVDARLTAAMPAYLGDRDAQIRRNACFASVNNWNDDMAPRLRELLRDPDEEVRRAAATCLRSHIDDGQIPIYRKIIEKDGVDAASAINLVPIENFSRAQLTALFSSTNLPVVSTAFTHLRRQNLSLKEIEPLLSNSLVMARMMGLGVLTEAGDRAAVERMMAMLHDPNEAVRWSVRARLRQLTGQTLGADPAAYEKWWAANKDTYTARPRPKRN